MKRSVQFQELMQGSVQNKITPETLSGMAPQS